MPIKNLLKVGLAGAAFLAFSVTGAISAPNIPCGTAKLIVPWGAGGGTDIIFRQIVEKVNKSGAKPQLQVVNVGGQGGNKGAKQAAKAKPDGCTLFAIHQSAITSYFTGRIDITWDAFEPVSMMTSTPSIIGANVNVPYNDLTELVAAAKKNPGSITAGGTFGSTSQFVFLLLEDAAGIKFKHVSYDGTKQRMTALLADNIKLGEINLAAAIKYIKAGKLKALGVTNPARLDQIPEMKTAQEQGYNLVYAVERGVVAPKGTSQEIIDHYASLLKGAAADAEFKNAMHKKGILITYKNASDYRDHFQATYDKWLPIAKKVGVYKRK
jgi:tripartite-type tricarboxylate transporter receptor subunit TctC